MTRRLVVLGGAGGIGRSLVVEAQVRGWQVSVADIDAALAGYRAPDGVEVTGFDPQDPAGLAQALSGGPESGFVNLAGFAGPALPVADTPVDDWRQLIEGNLTTAQRAAAIMATRIEPGGAMVMTGSGLGHRARAGYGGYAVAKAGIAALTRQLALELAPHIRVNCVAPSAVDTAFLRGGTGRSEATDPPRLDLAEYGARIPLQRIATPADVVGPILFLLSPDAAYVTGQCLHVNGGAHMP